MLIGLLRSRHGFRTVPGDVPLLDLRKLVSSAVRQAGGPVSIEAEGRAVAGARPAGIRRVVRRCRGSPGACRCRAGCQGSNSSIAAQMGAARPWKVPSAQRQVREHTMVPSTDDLGLVVVVGQAAIAQPSVITRAPGAEVPATKARRLRAEKSPIGASRMRRGSPSGDSSTAPAMRILPCGLRPCPPVAVFCGAEREGGLIDLDQVLKQAAIRIDHGTAACPRNCRARAGLGCRAPVPAERHEPRIVAAVRRRSFGHRGLLPAGRTFPARPAPLQFPAPVMAAGGADEAVGPAPGGEIGGFIESAPRRRRKS